MKPNANIYDQVTAKIIEQMEQGIVPWQRPWEGGEGSFMGCISHVSGKPYSFLNQWLLGGRTGEWLTYAQIQAEGGRVKAGEKSSMVVFWKYLDKIETVTKIDEDGNETTEQVISGQIPVLKSYSVFHIDQTTGITPNFENKPKPFGYEHEPIEAAEKVVTNYVNNDGLKLFVETSTRAFYRPSADEVHVPELRQYKVTEEFYSTLFHELTHSTGHAKRLNRREIAGVSFFGDENYSKEELVAEIGSAFLCQAVGIDCEKAFKNTVAYLQGWLKVLKNDKKLIVQAAAKAEAAAKYILSK